MTLDRGTIKRFCGFLRPAKMNVLQYMCVDMHGRAPLGLTPPSDPSDGCGAVADGQPIPAIGALRWMD